jgi:hypothetical protein
MVAIKHGAVKCAAVIAARMTVEWALPARKIKSKRRKFVGFLSLVVRLNMSFHKLGVFLKPLNVKYQDHINGGILLRPKLSYVGSVAS